MTKIVVALSGASGQVYGRRLLEVLAQTPGIETHLIISPSARAIIAHELGAGAPGAIEKLAAHVYENSNVGAAPASGSCLLDAMVVAPCSIKTMSAIAHSYADNLITRTADVMLKERRSLLLMPLRLLLLSVRTIPGRCRHPQSHVSRQCNRSRLLLRPRLCPRSPNAQEQRSGLQRLQEKTRPHPQLLRR